MNSPIKKKSFKLSWKYYLGLAILVVLILELMKPHATAEFQEDRNGYGWSKEEQDAFVSRCIATSVADLTSVSLFQYCACTRDETIFLFPSEPPKGSDSWSTGDLNRISSQCMEQVVTSQQKGRELYDEIYGQ